ncbi:zinc-dependent peptidase [Algoriphagus sp. CAU 1675]|uniref:zinc-dependent peptidase n=1 Tax=Algoriphagus sp. CAU 1675 TaxID=3032597 RepID=UPI0023DB33EB|nr:zinc-dependent peptidase [Algoriphagus sp. CAU 1675]MDF2159079.1 zinc-dependent peptidase [Algoriphagus sp. CAU 1675]
MLLLKSFFILGQFIQEISGRFFRYRLSPKQKEILAKHFLYYSSLRPRHQEEFLTKLEAILSTKQFIGRGGMKVVTEEMKVLIGATIVQVTFGLEKVALSHFKKVLIYPDSYYSRISKAYHRGEVNPRYGLIVLSWQSFVSGLADSNDGVNLGIHEVAHALKLENQIRYNGESDFFNPVLWEKYLEQSRQERENLKNGSDDFFRERGGVDDHEFFAVALENFFERPEKFKELKPTFYKTLVFLLRQDPITLKSGG